MPKYNLHVKVDGLWKAAGEVNANSDQEAVNIATRLFPNKLLRVTPECATLKSEFIKLDTEVRGTISREKKALLERTSLAAADRLNEMNKWVTYGPRLLQALKDYVSADADHLDGGATHGAARELISEIEGK